MGAASPDVVVVGAGLVGLSVAWQLARDHRVVVVDQAEQPGTEASAQNAGMVRRLVEDPYERQLAFRAHRFFEQPPDDWDGLDVSRVTGAVLALAYDRYHLHDAVAHGRAFDVRVEPCDRPADVAAALGGSPLQHVWYLPDERVAAPHAVLSGLLRGCRRQNVELRCGERVTGLDQQKGRVCGVFTDKGRVAAGAVVLAAGAWSGQLARQLLLNRPLFALRRSVLQSAAHVTSDPDHPWCWLDDAGVYVRPQAGGWLASPCDEALDLPPNGPGSTGSAQPLAFALAKDKIDRFFPALSDVAWRSGWTGLRTFAPDRVPVLGDDPEMPGLWWATALGGFGVTCSWAVGEAIAAWMRGETTPWLHRPALSPGRHFLQRWTIRPDGDLHNARFVDTSGHGALAV